MPAAVRVLNDDPLNPIGMGRRVPKSDRAAIVLHIQDVAKGPNWFNTHQSSARDGRTCTGTLLVGGTSLYPNPG